VPRPVSITEYISLQLVKEWYVVEVTANVVEDHANIIAVTANDNKINSSRNAVLPLVIHVIVGSGF
jgi:hypothetical protein